MNKTTKYSAPALDKGLEILEYLSAVSTPSSQSEIAQGLDRSPNEIYRILVGLEAKGYLLRDEASGKYRLSLKLYALSHTHSPIEQLRDAAHLPMMELADTLGHACHLSVPFENNLMVVSQVKSPNPVSLSIAEGTLFPLLSTVSGLVLLANYTEENQQRFLENDNYFARLDSDQQKNLIKQLTKIKSEGYYMADSELTLGVTNCASFVGQAESGIMAAVAMSSLTTNMNETRKDIPVIDEVKRTAEKINQRLGLFSKPST